MFVNLFENIEIPKKTLDLNIKYKDLAIEDLTNKSLNQCACISAGNTNSNLKETFTFIKNIQEANIDSDSPVYIYLKTSLQKSQFSSSLSPNSAATTVVFGTIIEVNDNYVTISTESNYTSTNGQAFISYNKISYIAFLDLKNYYSEYLQLISSTPPLCQEKPNQYLEMLKLLSSAISINSGSNKVIQLIFNGIRSAQFSVNSFYVIKNLVMVSSFFIIPINSVSGFDLLPPCIIPIKASTKMEE